MGQREAAMDLIVGNFKWVMLVGGLITLSMLSAAVAPRATFRLMFGDEPDSPLALLLARNWGVLIGLTGAMLVWGAFHPEVRTLVLLVAGVSKLTFIALVLSHPPYRARSVGPLVVDAVLVALFAVYLLAT
jgi:hypothetical protein